MPNSATTVAVHPYHYAGPELTGAELMRANPYRPWPARITSITELTATEKLFEFRLVDDKVREAFCHAPGQFVELSIFGVGEAPISISSSPTKRGFIELCVRRAGRFTERLHQMQCGEIVGIRGPFGRGFPIDDMRGHDVLLVAGGLGIAPLRSLINNIHDERSEFGKVTIIYGSRNPAEVMFRHQFEMWRHRRDFDLYLTVDHADGSLLLSMPYSGLAEGRHSVTLSAANNLGAATQRTIGFTVRAAAGHASIAVEERPARTSATFSVEHDLGDGTEGLLIIEDHTGSTVRSQSSLAGWDLTDNEGRPVASGVYRAYALLRNGLRRAATGAVEVIVLRNK